MSTTTDLSLFPHFDDYEEAKKFYRVLFTANTPVQTREMNQLQSILQNQIERMGSNLFKRGTIIDGVNFIFYDVYPYVKINDVQIDGTNAVPENYVGYFVKNEANLTAYVINYESGFESTDPDLKTLYLKYTNSGDSFNDTAFAAGQVLTIYDANSSIHDIDVIARGAGYSNADLVVITPTLLANVTSGSFSVGDIITDPLTGANGVITSLEDESERIARNILVGTVSVTASQVNVVGTSTTFSSDYSNGDYIALYSNSSSYELRRINVVANATFMNLTSNVSFTNTAASYANTSDSRVYIGYVPISSDLANTSSNANAWTFSVGVDIIGDTASDLAEVVEVIGENAAATIQTDSVGRITAATVTNRGTGYTRVPEVSVRSASGAAANLEAQNFLGQVTVSSLAGSIGSGYAFGITEGVIWQKGFMVKVDPQTVIINKYSRFPDDVTVGFETTEEIINSNIDTSLRDNAAGFTNMNAPGADRLKLTANLVVKTIEESDDDAEYFVLAEWSDGYPYKQNNRTFYNILADEMAKQLHEKSGSFVVDPFLVTTTTPSNSALSANTMSIVVDPGKAYVDGYRVETMYNYVVDSPKSGDTRSEENAKVSLNYENYVRVKEVGGMFEFDRANVVELYDQAKGFLSNASLVSTANLVPVGVKVGEARIRNFTYERGTPGSPNASYKLYMFDIRMNAGKNFRDVKTVYYNGTIKGIADVVLTPDSSTSSNIAVVEGKNNALLFKSGFVSPLNANNINYVYRTIDDTQDIANTGIVTITLTGSPNKVFPYTGTLTDVQKSEIYLVPQANLVAQANLTGTVSVNTTSASIVGSSTDFVGQLKAGQYLHLSGGASNTNIRRIVSITNSTFLTLDANLSFTQASVAIKRTWPANVPIELPYNTSYTANVNGSGDVLTINLGSTLNVATNTDVIVAYNVESQDPDPTTKTPQRSLLVKLRLANNEATTEGPWCLGVPDIFRLRGVYKGNSTVTTASSNVTDEFFIDHNQNSNYYNLGYLYKKGSSSVLLTDDDYLLVEFDAFTANPGFYTVSSYVSASKATRYVEDSKALADLSSTVNTLEIPEVFDDAGKYYDLISHVDFRPYVDATANVTSNSSLVTTNPANTISFASTDKYFPVPDSIYRHDVEYFVPRIDTVILDKSRNIKVLSGTPETMMPVQIPTGSLRLNDIFIPEYPSLPGQISSDVLDIINTRVYSNKFSNVRIDSKRVRTLFTETDYALQQPKNWTEKEIGSIERRVRDLEYYVAFSLIQTDMKDRVIPSSISPNIDRFKYGFFVDDYSNTSYSEITSPEYSASVIDDYAQPLLISFNVPHTGDGFASSPYDHVKIVSQTAATEDPPPPPPTTTTYVGGMTISPDHFKTQTYTHSTAPTPASTGGRGGGGKIVCTAMNESYGFGSFRNAIWIEHAASMDKRYEVGYHALFLPLVDLVYRSDKKDAWYSKLIRKVGERVARKRTADIWKRKRGKFDLEGSTYRAILEPICFVAGAVSNLINKRN